MVDSVDESLQRDLGCLGLLECVHGANGRDTAVFRLLSDADGGLTVDAVAERPDRERSTAYRSIARLVEADLVERVQVNYDDSGYYPSPTAGTPRRSRTTCGGCSTTGTHTSADSSGSSTTIVEFERHGSNDRVMACDRPCKRFRMLR